MRRTFIKEFLRNSIFAPLKSRNGQNFFLLHSRYFKKITKFHLKLDTVRQRSTLKCFKITEVILLRNTLERLWLPNKLKIMATFVGFMRGQVKIKEIIHIFKKRNILLLQTLP